MPHTLLFKDLFLDHVNELLNAEEQISEIIPKIIDVSSSSELRSALNHYLKDVKTHIEFLRKIMTEIKADPTGYKCLPVEGIIGEIDAVREKGGNSPAKDAGIIAGVQRLQHFKIALYGTARTYARHLNLNRSMDQLQRALNEEGEADRLLTRLAEGGVFTTGINEEACKENS